MSYDTTSSKATFVETLGTELAAILFESPAKAPADVFRELELLDARATSLFSENSWVRSEILPQMFTWAMIAGEYEKAAQAIACFERSPAFSTPEPLRKLALLEMKLWLASCFGNRDAAKDQVKEALQMVEMFRERILRIAGEIDSIK